jgi:hypothetical protein
MLIIQKSLVIATPWDKITTPWDKITTPWDKITTPWDKITTLWDKTYSIMNIDVVNVSNYCRVKSG